MLTRAIKLVKLFEPKRNKRKNAIQMNSIHLNISYFYCILNIFNHLIYKTNNYTKIPG